MTIPARKLKPTQKEIEAWKDDGEVVDLEAIGSYSNKYALTPELASKLAGGYSYWEGY